MSQTVHAFIDEYGDTVLPGDKPGPSEYFIITAVVVDDGDLEVAREEAELVRSRHFQTGEMKSSGVGASDKRRLRILAEIAELKINTISYVTDKAEIYKDGGLAHKRSFFKFLNRSLYQRLHRLFEDVSVVADEHGTEEFMVGFEEYLDRRIPKSLFGNWSFRFCDSKNEPLLQVGDIVSGTLARCFDPVKLSERADEFFDLIQQFAVIIDTWPPRRGPLLRKTLSPEPSDRRDELVRRYCLRQANIYAEQAASAPEVNLVRLGVLEYLLFEAQFGSKDEYVSTGRLVNHLRDYYGREVTVYQIRTDAIAPLRDEGVIIASSSSGYKVPTRLSDVHDFARHADLIVPKMLRRLAKARDELRAATLGEVDVLDSPEFEGLRQLVQVTQPSPDPGPHGTASIA
jgi:Protein of unknown function (DUF3800)